MHGDVHGSWTLGPGVLRGIVGKVVCGECASWGRCFVGRGEHLKGEGAWGTEDFSLVWWGVAVGVHVSEAAGPFPLVCSGV